MKKEIGERIKFIRESLRMSKEEFAKLIGVTGQYIGAVENGRSYLSIDKLIKLCQATNLSSDFILFGNDKDIRLKAKNTLTEFSDKQIREGCEILNKLALFIKYDN